MKFHCCSVQVDYDCTEAEYLLELLDQRAKRLRASLVSLSSMYKHQESFPQQNIDIPAMNLEHSILWFCDEVLRCSDIGGVVLPCDTW